MLLNFGRDHLVKINSLGNRRYTKIIAQMNGRLFIVTPVFQFQMGFDVLIPAHFRGDELSLCKYYSYIVAYLFLVACLIFVTITARVLARGGRLPCAVWT